MKTPKNNPIHPESSLDVKANTSIFSSLVWIGQSISLWTMLCCFIGIASLNAQYRINGEVADKLGAPIEFATIMLFDSDRKEMVKGIISDENGQFEIEVIGAGQYALTVSMLGYEAFKTAPFSLRPPHFTSSHIIVLKEESHTLEAVEVVAKTPLLEQKADRMILNVGKSLTGLNGSLMDIVKKIPGMVVVNGRLNLAGNSNPTILIDGRSTKYLDVVSLLSEMPGTQIERIELIHQPGAEFEASGTGPIINIILKKNKRYGFNGSIHTGFGKGSHWRSNTGFSMNSRHGAFNLYGGAGYNYNSQQEYLLLNRNLDGYTFTSFNDQPNLPKTYRANIGLDWNLNNRQQVGFSLHGHHSNNNNRHLNNTIIQYGEAPLVELETVNATAKQSVYYGGETHYNLNIDTMGQALKVKGNYTSINQSSRSRIQTQNTNDKEHNLADQRNEAPETNKIFAISADYTKPINTTMELQVGGKFSRAKIDNHFLFENLHGLQWNAEGQQENQYAFSENISAVYGKLNFALGKWEGIFGLRYENSDAQGHSITIDSVNSRSISDLFPSASIYRSLTSKIGLSFAYSYRIERPDYSSLNPFVIYFDPFTQQQGNPNIRPELTHSTKLSLSYDRHPFISLEYTRTNDVITNLTEQDPLSKSISSYSGNIERYDKIGGTLFYPLSFIPGIEGYGGVMLYNEGYQNKTLEARPYSSRRWTFMTFIQMQFNLPGKIKTEINGWYTTGGQDGIIHFEAMYGLNLGIEKQLFKNKISVGLSVDNLVNRFFFGHINYGNTTLDMESRWDRKLVNFNLRYHFGKN